MSKNKRENGKKTQPAETTMKDTKASFSASTPAGRFRTVLKALGRPTDGVVPCVIRSDGGMYLKGINEGNTVLISIDAGRRFWRTITVTTPGEFALPVDGLSTATAPCREDDDVTLIVSGNEIVVQSTTIRHVIPAMDIERVHRPKVPKWDPQVVHTVGVSVLQEALRQARKISDLVVLRAIGGEAPSLWVKTGSTGATFRACLTSRLVSGPKDPETPILSQYVLDLLAGAVRGLSGKQTAELGLSPDMPLRLRSTLVDGTCAVEILVAPCLLDEGGTEDPDGPGWKPPQVQRVPDAGEEY